MASNDIAQPNDTAQQELIAQPNDIAQQMFIEHEVLGHIMASLRSIIDWRVSDTGASRKLSSLTFVTQAFQRHFDRLMNLEEQDGYMSMVTAENPSLTETVDSLRDEHEVFRSEITRILSRLEHLNPDEYGQLDLASGELLALLAEIDRHGSKEIQLIQQALLQDEGGEA